MYLKNPSAFRGAVLFSVSIFAFVAVPLPAFSHGFAGDRFFPATLTTDDPFAASELSLPTFSEIRQPGQPPVKVFDTSTDLSLLVLPRTALTIGDGYSIQKVADQSAQTGFDNAAVNVLYEFFENDKHEASLIYLQQHVKDIGLKAPFDHLIPLVEFSMSTHTEPAVGSQIHGAPTQVKIWFTEKLEPALSKIQVFDTSGGEVDKRDVKIDQSNGALLIVSLPALTPSKYKVVWHAVSVDTHVTTGNLTFELL